MHMAAFAIMHIFAGLHEEKSWVFIYWCDVACNEVWQDDCEVWIERNVGVAKNMFSIGNLTLAVEFFYSTVPTFENKKENCCRLWHVLKLIGPGARAAIVPPYSNVCHIGFIIRSLPLAKLRYYVNVGCAEAIMCHVRIEFPHPINVFTCQENELHPGCLVVTLLAW
jgi:hypothetical protein